jgi:hypothetical protein
MKANSIFLILFLLASTNLAAQQVSPHAQKAVQAIQRLRAIGMSDTVDVDPAPPPQVPSLLRRLNQELRALIAEDLNDPSRHAVPNEHEILEELTAAGWEEVPSHKWNAYGEIRQIKFDWKTGYEPGILVVSTQLWLPCGSADPDSAIYVFQGVARRWDLVLAAESDFDPAGENDVTGMQYKISPPDSHGRWFLVVAHVPPSCRRAATTVSYKALRPGTGLNQPIGLLSGRESINPFFQPAFRVDTEKYSFALTLGKLRKLDGEAGIAIFRYGLSGDDVRRMAPLALAPEDFLDQWAQLNWDEAKRWTRAPSDPVIEEWHSKLKTLASDSTEIESVHLCSGTSEGDGDWLLELSVDGRLNPSLKETTLYVAIAKAEGTFVLNGVLDKPPSGCSGRTPLKPIVEPSLPSW